VAAAPGQAGNRAPRILLTLGLAPGKTLVAFQIAWKLKQAGAVRTSLSHRPRLSAGSGEDQNFGPFRAPATGSLVMLILPRRAIPPLISPGGRNGRWPLSTLCIRLLRSCHRWTSAPPRARVGRVELARWCLDHSATRCRIGMTATPLHADNRDTYGYFGIHWRSTR